MINEQVIKKANKDYLESVNSSLNVIFCILVNDLLERLSNNDVSNNNTDEQKAFLNTIQDLHTVVENSGIAKVMFGDALLSHLEVNDFVKIDIFDNPKDNNLLNFSGKLTFPYYEDNLKEPNSSTEPIELTSSLRSIYKAIFQELMDEDDFIRSTESLTSASSVNELCKRVCDRLNLYYDLFDALDIIEELSK